MSDKDDSEKSLVPSQPAALSRKGAAALATRGLRELSRRDIRWRHSYVNFENSGGLDSVLAISSRGLVASTHRSGSESTHAIAIFDIKTGEQVTINSPAFDY